MKASMAAATGRLMLVGSSSRRTTVTVTRNAMGSRHSTTAAPGPLHSRAVEEGVHAVRFG
jgi:hypothetical protein